MKIEETVDKYLTEKIFTWNKDKMMKIGWKGREVVLYADSKTTNLGSTISLMMEIDPTQSKLDTDDIIRAFKQDAAFKLDFTEKFEDVIKAGFRHIKEINKPMKNIIQVVYQ